MRLPPRWFRTTLSRNGSSWSSACLIEKQSFSERGGRGWGADRGPYGREELATGPGGEGCTGLIVENLEVRNYTDMGIGVYQSTELDIRNLVVHTNGSGVWLESWEIEGYGIAVDESQGCIVEGNNVYEDGPRPGPWGVLGTGINT